MEHNPPVASRVRGQTSMAQSLKFPNPGIHIAVGQNWVPGAALKALGTAGPGYGLHVPVFRSSLGDHQVIVPADFIEMGPLPGICRRCRTRLGGGRKCLPVSISMVHWPIHWLPARRNECSGNRPCRPRPRTGRVDAALFYKNRIGPFSPGYRRSTRRSSPPWLTLVVTM